MEGLNAYITTSDSTRPLSIAELDKLFDELDWSYKPNRLIVSHDTYRMMSKWKKEWDKEDRDKRGYRVHGGYIFRKRRGTWEFVKGTPKRPLRRR